MGYITTAAPKSTSTLRGGFSPFAVDTFNARATEWCRPIMHFWKRIVESANQNELNAILWEADAVAKKQEPVAIASCERFLSAAYKTHLWRIRHGDKSFS